ncbi:MAG TPA: Rieske (2Fe-2S) protein [Streptosporangiaceae bacterium]|jgi:Rieske Fe-S protein
MASSRVPAASRRTLLACAGAACAAALAGCARYNSSNGGIDASQPAQGSSTPAASTSPSRGAAGSGGPPVLARTTDIPVGGGKILTSQRIVITQPKAGSFVAFTAVCTHAGCTVTSVTGGTINCPCHGSRFNIVNGSVVDGPATSPLAPVSIKVQGSSIVQA